MRVLHARSIASLAALIVACGEPEVAPPKTAASSRAQRPERSHATPADPDSLRAPPAASEGASSAPAASASGATPASKRPAGLEVVDVVVGTGAEARRGAAVTVHYTGKLADGRTFDSSVDRGRPFTFIIGNATVIKGWEEGVVGMKTGGKRTLTIPPNLGYGADGKPPKIPPASTLVFDIELLHVVE